MMLSLNNESEDEIDSYMNKAESIVKYVIFMRDSCSLSNLSQF